MCTLTISGPGTLLSGSDNETQRTSSHVMVLRLKGLSMIGKSTLISSGITMLFFLDRHKEASVVFLLTAAKKLVEFICYGFWIYRINFLSLFLIVRAQLIIFQRVPGFF